MRFIACLVFLILFILSDNVIAQSENEQHLEFETRSYAATQDYLPFWLWANQKGRVSEQGKYHQTGLLKFDGSVEDSLHKFKLTYGTSLVSDLCTRSAIQVNEAYLTIAWQKVFLKIGEQAARTQLAGLSATNGDMYYSNNSRPYPSLLFGTNGFIKLYKNFSFSAIYEEALIRDQYEYVENPNLHHKNLFLRWGKSENWRITAGLEDYAWWGGTSPDATYGKLPSGFGDYLRVIMSRPGGPEAPETERDNAAGNHLGQYKLAIEKEVAGQSFLFYLCHPIEDKSGYKWQNYQDNLYGLFWEKKQKQTLISSALVEFYFTRDQNVHPTNSIVPPEGQGPVNYFNHGVYRSGFTYKGNVIGVPLFYPVVYDSNGKITGIENTRFYAFHGGVGGTITPRDHYKLLLTYSMNSGIWNSYPNRLKRISTLFEYTCIWSKSFSINCGLAADYTQQAEVQSKVLGGYIGAAWRFLP